MKIIKYKKISSSKYEIILENNEKIKLYEDVILEEELLLKGVIEDINNILEINKKYEIYDISLKYLSKHLVSYKSMKDYLLRKNYLEQDVLSTLKKLQEKGFLNDLYFAKCYINDHVKLTNDGPYKIKRYLEDNNISSDIYEELLHNYDYLWYEKIHKYIEKQLKVNKKSSYYFKNKMVINLISLGYDKEMINDCLSKIKLDNEEDLREKMILKIRKKLARKYSGDELEKKIKEKLYQQGFFE